MSDSDVKVRIDGVDLPHGRLELPAFLPDATVGVVRTLDAVDLEGCGVEALVMNTFHLTQRPGSSTVAALGGLHKMTGWRKPIVTDSGGFQAYSLIRQNPKFGSINDRGIIFRPEGSDRKFQLTPEKTVQLQIGYGSDVVITLDDCTHVDGSYEVQLESVNRTIRWGKRCKEEFERLVKGRDKKGEHKRPLLFGVIQGGGYPELRKRCAEELLAIGFDGFGFGGWPLDAENKLLTDIIAFTRSLVPGELPMHALGVGHPVNIVECYKAGYDMFDSAMPTRDARHGRLYVFTSEAEVLRTASEGWFAFRYVTDDKYMRSDDPVSGLCDCLACARYSMGYMHHLFKIGDSLFMRLATIHNLRFMSMLMGRIVVGSR
ncbi:MAG: tRNA guanosine(34) transglycosylase Tgt [Chloroflexia bacterium]